jgi:uncharacterized protein YcgI (DUF1989 family)
MPTIPARRGVAARMTRGQTIDVTNTHGQQVVDTWAFASADADEFMSMEHSRAHFRKLRPAPGDAFVTNRRRPILTLVEDSSPGVHDTLIAACDPERYRQLGAEGHHDNCTENLAAALAAFGLRDAGTPCPLNLFMNIPWASSGDLRWEEPVSRAGDYVRLRAEMDLIIVFSACPMDLLPINGRDQQPMDARFEIAG